MFEQFRVGNGQSATRSRAIQDTDAKYFWKKRSKKIIAKGEGSGLSKRKKNQGIKDDATRKRNV